MADINRNRAVTTNGPPPFVPLKDYRGKSTKSEQPSRQQVAEVKAPKPPQLEPEKLTRVQMDKPMERMQRKPDRKPEASLASRPLSNPATRGERRQGRGRQREEDDDYQPSSRPQTDCQLADWFGKKLNLSDKAEEKLTFDTMPESREETKKTTEYLNPRRDDYNSSSRGRGRRRGQVRDQAPRRDHFESSARTPFSKQTSYHERKSEDIDERFDNQSFRSKKETHKYTRTESKEPQKQYSAHKQTNHKQSQYESSKQKEAAPAIREVWTQPVSSDNHWDWLGSATTAVPFSAKRQNN